MYSNRLLFAALGAAFLVSMMSVGAVAAASPTIECGQLSAYTAPNPAGPTDGSLQIGRLDPWVVLASATISAAATSALPSIVGSAPTCLALGLDSGGKVTAIDFAAHGTVSGHVILDTGSGFYVFADRLIIPPVITDTYPGLKALIVTSYQAQTVLTITFSVEGTDGSFTGFDGHAYFCGTATITPSGDGQVGEGVIPEAVLDAGDIVALQSAGERRTCAAVHAVGTVDRDSGGTISITTDVVITVAAPASTPVPNPTGPPSDTADAAFPTSRHSTPLAPVLVVVVLVTTVMTTRRFGSRSE
jgi:hypothetical protein